MISVVTRIGFYDMPYCGIIPKYELKGTRTILCFGEYGELSETWFPSSPSGYVEIFPGLMSGQYQRLNARYEVPSFP